MRDQWREIVRWFLLEQSSQNISIRTGFERRRVLIALTIIRTSLMKDVPEIFLSTIEVDETYFGGNGRINEGLSEIRDLNENEAQRNNQFSESSVVTVRSGPRLSKTLELKHSNLSSQKKLQPIQLSVQIPGEHTPVSLREDTFTVS
jgi:hypothetical protein